MSLDDHRRAFAAGIAAVLAEFNAYLVARRDGASLELRTVESTAAA
jgi:hypothetical protein